MPTMASILLLQEALRKVTQSENEQRKSNEGLQKIIHTLMELKTQMEREHNAHIQRLESQNGLLMDQSSVLLLANTHMQNTVDMLQTQIQAMPPSDEQSPSKPPILVSGGAQGVSSDSVVPADESPSTDILFAEIRKVVTAGGRQSSPNRTLQQAKRAVHRKEQPGLAIRLAKVFEMLLRKSNVVHNLTDVYPLTIRHVLEHMDGGSQILESSKQNQEKDVLASAAVELVQKAGHSCKSSVVGVLATTSNGSMSATRLADITGVSVSHVYKAKKKAEHGTHGAFFSLQRWGDSKVQQLCPTRLDRSLGACEHGEDCKLLHVCQCCNDGSTCAAFQCNKWSALLAAENDKRRVQKTTKDTRNHCSDLEVYATKVLMEKLAPARSGTNNSSSG